MEGPYGNAMTEIALALAMAFFSIMVLTMVSMGAGATQPKSATAQDIPNPARFAVVRSDPDAAQAPLADGTRIVIFHHNRFLNTDLKAFDTSALDPDDAVILAIDPALPLADAVSARARLKAANITVTTLDKRWMRTLKETSK